MERIQSNGLLFGVKPECDDYPVCTTQIQPGDLLRIHTEGVTEPENARGEFFGDNRLEEVARDYRWRSPSALLYALLAEMKYGTGDRITLPNKTTALFVVIDVIQPLPTTIESNR